MARPLQAEQASYENYVYVAISIDASPTVPQRLPGTDEVVETTSVHEPEGVAVFLFEHSESRSLHYQVQYKVQVRRCMST